MLGHSEHSEPSPYFDDPDDIPSTSTPAYDFLSTSRPIYPSHVPSTSDVFYFDFQLASVSNVSMSIPLYNIPSTSEIHQFDISFALLPPSDVLSILEVHPVDIIYRRRR